MSPKLSISGESRHSGGAAMAAMACVPRVRRALGKAGERECFSGGNDSPQAPSYTRKCRIREDSNPALLREEGHEERVFSARVRRHRPNLWNTQPMHGDFKLEIQSANSSSCGDRIVHSMLSIGRRFGRKKPSIRELTASEQRKVWGFSD